MYKAKQEIGLNIDNFVTSYNFSNIVMREEISTFLTYVEFFHKLHTKYLKRFSNKIQLMYMHINTDIRFDETMEIEHAPTPSPSEDDESDEVLSDIKKSFGLSPIKPYRSASGSIAPGSVGSIGDNTKRSGSKSDHKFSNHELRTLFTEINMSCDNILMTPGVKEDIGSTLDTARDDLDEDSIHNNADTLRLDEIREPHQIELITEKAPSPIPIFVKAPVEEPVQMHHASLEPIVEETAEEALVSTEGTQALTEGTQALTEGTQALSEGTQALSEGIQALSEGTQALTEGTQALSEGIRDLTEGTQALSEGIRDLTEGTQALTEGIPVLSEDPIIEETPHEIQPQDFFEAPPVEVPPPKKKRTYNRSKSKATT